MPGQESVRASFIFRLVGVLSLPFGGIYGGIRLSVSRGSPAVAVALLVSVIGQAREAE